MVLALLALGTLVVLPTLRVPPRATGDERPVERARTLALRRAEQLRLTIAPDGRWMVTALSDTTDTPVLTGVAPADSVRALPAELTISALGACLPVRPLSDASRGWDPARCATVTR